MGEARIGDSLRRRSESVRQRVERRLDEQYANQAARAALTDLGYEVEEEGFATLFVEGGEVHFQRAGWGDYFVSMKVDTSDGRMNFRVMRTENDDESVTRERQLQDKEMETSWCNEYPDLIATLAHRGISTKSIRRLPPGAVPVQVVQPANTKMAQRKRRATQAPVRQKKRSL